ncbi:MAG: hypothetical protein K2I28_08090 [Muribaculaceae bacterium]|nr:hypothetical protein [Muribaculaceae bacterium]
MSPVIPSLVSLVNLLYFIYIGIDNVTFLAFATINVFITTWVMFNNERQPFTEIKIVNLFVYIFFVLANAVQYSRDTIVLTFRFFFTDGDYSQFQMVVCLILLLLNGAYSIFHRTMLQKSRRKSRACGLISSNPSQMRVKVNLLLVLSVVAFLIIFASRGFNPTRMLFRGIQGGFGDHASYSTMQQTDQLLLNNFIRPIPFAVLIIFYLGNVAARYRKMAFILMFLTVCPTGIARNAAAMYWLPVIVLYCGKYLRHHKFMWGMVFALFVLFPFMNIFRSWSGAINFEWSMDFFNDINFDAGQIFMATMKTDMITYGYQLLGPLLFFVPRAWWPGKPIGSGAVLVDSHHGSFNNVSMPYFGEGYVNFGFIGVLAFALFLSWICAKFDVSYWQKWRISKSYKIGYYLIFMGALVFIMRGDLMSSTAYTVGIMVSYTCCVIIGTNLKILPVQLKKR